jgi:opacity protein-like surface antigen
MTFALNIKPMFLLAFTKFLHYSYRALQYTGDCPSHSRIYMKKNFLALGLLVALASPAAFAANTDYTFVEGGYVNDDGFADGAYLKGSYDIGRGFYAHGQYVHLDAHNSSFHYEPAELGLGWRMPVGARADFLAEAAALQVHTSFGTAHGYRASVGVRGDLTSKLEGLARVNYIDGHNFNGNATGTLGLQYKFNPTWGITSEVNFGQGDEVAQLGVRASF